MDKDSLLTQVFLSLFALVNHSKEEMALSTEYSIDPYFELNVAIKDVERCLTKDDSVLAPIFLQNFATVE